MEVTGDRSIPQAGDRLGADRRPRHDPRGDDARARRPRHGPGRQRHEPEGRRRGQGLADRPVPRRRRVRGAARDRAPRRRPRPGARGPRADPRRARVRPGRCALGDPQHLVVDRVSRGGVRPSRHPLVPPRLRPGLPTAVQDRPLPAAVRLWPADPRHRLRGRRGARPRARGEAAGRRPGARGAAAAGPLGRDPRRPVDGDAALAAGRPQAARRAMGVGRRGPHCPRALVLAARRTRRRHTRARRDRLRARRPRAALPCRPRPRAGTGATPLPVARLAARPALARRADLRRAAVRRHAGHPARRRGADLRGRSRMSALATRVPRQPITFVYGNLVWGPFSDEVWAVYGLEMQSYEGRPRRGKIDLMGDLADAADGLEADFQLLRITRQWSLEDYVAAAEATVDARHGHVPEWRAVIDSQRARLERRAIARPEVYLALRVSHSARTLEARAASMLRAPRRDVRRELKRAFGLSDPRGLRESQLADVLADERDAYQRLADYLGCQRASTATLQWLVCRSLCRGLGEPAMDDNFQPQAIVLDDDGERRFVPLEHDVLRLFEPRITIMARDGRWPKCLRIESELGESWQAFLTFGALADTTVFPGPSAELLFAPLEAVDFPVDAVFSARHI